MGMVKYRAKFRYKGLIVNREQLDRIKEEEKIQKLKDKLKKARKKLKEAKGKK